ncbi:major facilitator superfamily domain-containing protein [Aspergillus pseudodeflectus]|uniref:Major facilitator superfamily domain-containing protein n=1 Tax=Aspergillus pseudodeflectus TaxID=176178 RepID=A0ABR4KYS9_9EURO
MAGLSQNEACRSCQHQEDSGARPPPWKVEFRSSKGFVTWVVAIAVFTDVFIYGMIIPILPEVLKTRIVVPADELQKWMSILLAAYGGALFVGSPVFGYYADRSSSRRTPFLIGLLALGGSTVMFWFAQSATALVIARTLQGLSAAVVWTVSMALIVDTVGKDQVGAAMGIVSMAMTVGTVSGPFIGGLVLSKAGYHAVFSIAIALILLDIALRLVMIERKNALEWLQDQPASVEETERLLEPVAPGDSLHKYAAIPREAEQSASEGGKVADDGLAESSPSETKAKKRSVPGIVRLLCSGALLVVLAAAVLQAVAYSSFDTVLPLYVMSTFKMGPMGIGLCFIPLFTPSFFSTLIGSAVDHYGSRRITLLAFLIDVPYFLLLQLVAENTTHDKILLYILLFFAGLAAALKTVALMVEVNHVVGEKEKECPGIFGEQGGTAQAYGLYNVAWSGGQVLGPLVAGWLVEWKGWATMVSVFGIVSGGMAVVLAVTSKDVVRLVGRG